MYIHSNQKTNVHVCYENSVTNFLYTEYHMALIVYKYYGRGYSSFACMVNLMNGGVDILCVHTYIHTPSALYSIDDIISVSMASNW